MTQRRLLLLGPPGTGKTTRLLREMESRLKSGTSPARVAFVSFTRAAIKDAKDRACAQFNFTYDDLPLMRTLHSLAFYLLGLRRSDVFGREALQDLADLTGEELTGKLELDAPTLGERGDALLALDQYARSALVPLDAAWRAHGATLDWYRLRRFVDAYDALRQQLKTVDFTDMIEQAVAKSVKIDADIAFVDEAQDLTPLQWQFVETAFRDVPELIVSGDDDQCQPAGTIVTTLNGPKPIETLDPNIDKLICFDSGAFTGFRNGATFSMSKRFYQGDLFTVRAAERITRCTQEHLWRVRWSKEAKKMDHRLGNRFFDVATLNILPELMEVALYDGKSTIRRWAKIQTTKESNWTGEVFSLNVDKFHTYVADGITTHNCVYAWAGASSTALLNFQGDKEVLAQSHRLPRAVWQVAADVAHGIGHRYQKDFQPADREGQVEWLARPEEVDLSVGTWLLLARTRRQLTDLTTLARDQGVIYALGDRSSADPAHVAQLLEYERFRAGDPNLPLWHDALTAIPLEIREYYLSCLRRDKRALNDAPRVRVATIHGAKGLEAEHVVLLTDLNARILLGAELDPDAEQRVLYVGVTRARESLYLVEPRGGRGYEL